MKKKLATGAMVGAAFAVGLSLNVFTYDSTGTALNGGNAGIVVSVKEVPVCLGLEVKGAPGFFGGSYDGCDF